MADVPSSKSLIMKSGLGRISFESRPHIINVATNGLSKEFAQDERHPLSIPSAAKLMDFDHNKLHWRIKTVAKPLARATVRSHAIRKARLGIIQELKRRGYDQDGRVISSENAQTSRKVKPDLKGAMVLNLEQDVLLMSLKATEDSCKHIVNWLISKQNERPAPSRRDHDDRYNRPFKMKSYIMARQYLEDLQK